MLDLNDIRRARERVGEHVIQTPCTPTDVFSDLFNGRAWFKFENLQRTGSFKERGALNRLLDLDDEGRKSGVIAASAGNHAQGVSYHARRLGVPATIVMPERTPLVKVTNTRRLGARVVLHGRDYDEAMERVLEIQREENLVLVHAFDDPAIVAGQGTIGLELREECPNADVVVVPVGGGGLISGIALALKELSPNTRVVGVETNVLPSAKRAREQGSPVTVDAADTIADGIAVRRISELTHSMISRYVDDLVTVSEEEIASAVLLLLEREKTVVEPAAATSLAAVVGGHIDGLDGRNVVMVLSGGNIDVNLLSRIIDRGLVNDGRLADLLVRVRDRPGALAALTKLIADAGANVLRLDHHRGTEGLWLTDVDVELTLETRGREHVAEMVSSLTEAGYSVEVT